MKDDLIIERLDALRALVVRHGEDLGYVVIDEVVSRTKRRAVVRMDLTPEALADWLEEDELPAELDGGEDPDEGDDEPDDEPDDEIPGEAKLNEETQALCRALLRWLPAELESQLGDRPKQTFKLSLYQPKGDYLESKNVRVWRRVAPRPPTDPTREASLSALVPTAAPSPSLPALTTPPAPSAPPTAAPVSAPVSASAAPVFAIALGGDGQGQLVFLDPDTIPEARVWRALGRATEELLVTVGRTYSGIIELQARTVLHQSEQLDRSQRLVETLAGRLLEARHVQAREETESRVDESQLRVREELGKTFLSELGTLGRVLVTSRVGLAPELAELGELVGGSPELSEAMRDPSRSGGLRAMLKDEGTRKELAQLLRIAARRGSGEDGGAPQAA